MIFLHIFTTFIVRITCQAFLVICGSTTLACKMSAHIFCRNHMGPFGTMKWTDGRCYEGQFRDGISGLILSLSFFQHRIVLYRMLTIPNNAANAVNSLWETVSFSQARSMAKASFLGLMDDRTQARKDLRTWGYAKLSNKTWPINYINSNIPNTGHDLSIQLVCPWLGQWDSGRQHGVGIAVTAKGMVDSTHQLFTACSSLRAIQVSLLLTQSHLFMDFMGDFFGGYLDIYMEAFASKPGLSRKSQWEHGNFVCWLEDSRLFGRLSPFSFGKW